MAGGVAAYTVEWLEDYKELVFEITLDGGVFLINAHGAHRRFSPQASRQIWRRLIEILWWYPQLRGVNIQAGDFVGRVQADEQVELKLTTARLLGSRSHTGGADTRHAQLPDYGEWLPERWPATVSAPDATRGVRIPHAGGAAAAFWGPGA